MPYKITARNFRAVSYSSSKLNYKMVAELVSAERSIFLTNPCKTFPGPTSTKLVAPSLIIF